MRNEIDIVDSIKNIYQSENSLELLIDFERVVDQLDTYTFKNWELGELCEGPISEKYWVTCSFFWPCKLMPDPSAAKRMLHYGIRVEYSEDKLNRAVDVKDYGDYQEGTKLPKMTKVPVWVVEISIPKRLISDIFKGSVELGGEDVDLTDLDDAYDSDLDQQGTGDANESTGAEPEQEDELDDFGM